MKLKSIFKKQYIFFLGIILLFLIVIIYLQISSHKITTICIEDDSIWSKNITPINDFDYTLDGNKIYIGTYNGNDKKIWLNSSYIIDGKECHVAEIHDTSLLADAKSVIIPDGTVMLGNNIFWSSRTEYIYLPSTLSNINQILFDNFWELKEIYFGGTAEQWNILTDGKTLPDGLKISFDVAPNKLY